MIRGPVLVVAAHPDDEVLGCGATIARLATDGVPVTIAILGEGITSRHDARDDADPGEVAALRATSERVASSLGATVEMFGLPDNRFDTVPLLDVVKIVEDLIARVAPQTIFTHHRGDLNVDHVVLHRAVMTATRPVDAAAVPTVLAFEVPSSSEWAFDQFDSFRPTLFVDVESTLQAKIDAMELYEGEARPFPHPRSPQALEALARRRGSTAGLRAAEAFELVRAIR